MTNIEGDAADGQMAQDRRQAELRDMPLRKADPKNWPPGIRTVGLEELDALGVDASGNLFWHGKPVEVRHRVLLRRSEFAWLIIGAGGAALSGIAAMFPFLPRVFDALVGQ